MRKRIWLLASCGIVGVAFGLAAADAPPAHSTDEFFGSSLTEPISTSPTDDSNNPSGDPLQAPEKRTGAATPSPRTGSDANAEPSIFDAADSTAPPRKTPT